MKKLLCVLLSVVLLCSCGETLGDAEEIFSSSDGETLSYAVFYDGESLATLNVKDEKYYIKTRSENGEEKTVYTLADGNYAYELYAGDGTIAFFERSLYTNRDERCTLKVINTKTNDVYTPFSKVIVYDNYDVQSRFIEIDGNDVYYITSSLTLGETRIMKYTQGEDEPVEFTTLSLTKNDLSFGHSITSFGIDNGKLICACLDGYSNVLQIFDLKSGVCEKKKLLPSNVGVVYSVSYCQENDTAAMYYSEVDKEGKVSAEHIGTVTGKDENITVLYTLEENEKVNRETVHFDGEYVCFNISDSDDISYKNFKGIIINSKNQKSVSLDGCMLSFTKNGTLYNISIDKNDEKRATFNKMTVDF